MPSGKIVLLTGGTGSFGTGFISHLLADPDIAMVRVFSRDEHKQHRLRETFKGDRVSFYIGDVRDRERLADAMAGVHWVVHAAALKQAPIGEIEPQEFIKTNVMGSMNVVQASLYRGIEKAVLISTDKAVEPANLYGATKMCAEKLFLQADKMRGERGTRFAVVRYGNVAGTNGSVIPYFLSLPDSAPTPITDPEATRFWITLDEANRFVLTGLKLMTGGEVMIPQMPSVRILELAEAVRPGKTIRFIGARPGEKRHEVIGVDLNTGERKSSDKNRFLTVEQIRRHVFPSSGVLQ